jgi:hypothetical protein
MTIRFILGIVVGFMLGTSIALTVTPDPRATRRQLWETILERRRALGRAA